MLDFETIQLDTCCLNKFIYTVDGGIF